MDNYFDNYYRVRRGCGLVFVAPFFFALFLGLIFGHGPWYGRALLGAGIILVLGLILVSWLRANSNTAYVPPTLTPTAPPVEPRAKINDLHTLERLRQRGVIDDAEYEARLRESSG